MQSHPSRQGVLILPLFLTIFLCFPGLLSAAEDNRPLPESLPQLLSPLAKGATVAFKGITSSEKSKELAELATIQIDPMLMSIAQQKGISFLERAALKVILEEWALNDITASGVDSGARNLLGADYLITGKVQKQGDRTYCTLKTLELKSGKIISFCHGWLNITASHPGYVGHGITTNQGPQTQTTNNHATSSEGNLQLWTNKKRYTIGDIMTIYFTVEKPYYVQLIDVDPTGKITTIFPNPYQPDNLCYPGNTYQIPPRNAPFELKLTPPSGVDRIKAIASPNPIPPQIMRKTRGISFTKKLIQAAPTRTQLTFQIE